MSLGLHLSTPPEHNAIAPIVVPIDIGIHVLDSDEQGETMKASVDECTNRTISQWKLWTLVDPETAVRTATTLFSRTWESHEHSRISRVTLCVGATVALQVAGWKQGNIISQPAGSVALKYDDGQGGGVSVGVCNENLLAEVQCLMLPNVRSEFFATSSACAEMAALRERRAVRSTDVNQSIQILVFFNRYIARLEEARNCMLEAGLQCIFSTSPSVSSAICTSPSRLDSPALWCRKHMLIFFVFCESLFNNNF